jgi:hypothetical protein
MKTKVHYYLILIGLVTIFTIGCSKDMEKAPDVLGYESCLDCHTNYAHLQKVYSPDTTGPAGGCGGEAPHYEPFDRVYMGGDDLSDFIASSHGSMSCTACHGGVDSTGDKRLAHSGNFLAHPSTNYTETCGECHSEITDNFSTSIHNGYGQMRAVALRSGKSGPDEFHLLPQHQIEGYTKNCATCHGTCGNCHVVRPPIGGGGLAAGHMFTKKPDMINVCVTCHTSRGGHAYLGVAAGTQPDVHLTKAQFDCLNCHTGQEMHGNGKKVTQRYAYDELPTCKDCHSSSGVHDDNLYHSLHWDNLNCQTCHSQDYNNCGSCHVGGSGARIPSYLDFKIASNPIRYLKPEFRFTTVRRTLGAPDNWSVYGVEEYANFNALPTYNYTSPHNILRWTSRTQVAPGEGCATKCHIMNVDGVLVNKELYLFMDDLLEWEIGATGHITVDDKLPSIWFKKK